MKIRFGELSIGGVFEAFGTFYQKIEVRMNGITKANAERITDSNDTMFFRDNDVVLI